MGVQRDLRHIAVTERNTAIELECNEKRLHKNCRRFSVAGPKILSSDGDENDNPMFDYMISAEFCDFMIRRKKADVFWSRLYMYDLLQLFRRTRSKLKISHRPERVTLLPDGIDGKVSTGKKMGRDRKGEHRRKLFEFEQTLIGWKACKQIIDDKKLREMIR